MFNTSTLGELMEKQLMEFGIYLELEPDEEEKQMLENNIQTALSQKLIELDDAIDIMNIAIQDAKKVVKNTKDAS